MRAPCTKGGAPKSAVRAAGATVARSAAPKSPTTGAGPDRPTVWIELENPLSRLSRNRQYELPTWGNLTMCVVSHVRRTVKESYRLSRHKPAQPSPATRSSADRAQTRAINGSSSTEHSSAAPSAAVALNSHVAAHGAVKGKHIRVGFDDTLCDATATHPQPLEARHAGESHVP